MASKTKRPAFERIPDSADNIAKAVLVTKPKKAGEWKYMRKGKRG